jgi:plasmid stability protein
MRTTLVIDDDLFRELKTRAAEERRTLSEVTREVLRRGLARPEAARRPKRVKLRSFAMGKSAVDLADRNQLFDLLDRS